MTRGDERVAPVQQEVGLDLVGLLHLLGHRRDEAREGGGAVGLVLETFLIMRAEAEDEADEKDAADAQRRDLCTQPDVGKPEHHVTALPEE
ncbi:hypothetical protein mvi_16230 [Methylobacterium indicum]|uniref:Uncharacterized protein n=1 Tax=Methylobacterium indicum TaxID=1775910 RepID=A0A8H9C3T2_9HYPH|nr:hypothetical protein mvi_16230 [Methylobacterium indicum]